LSEKCQHEVRAKIIWPWFCFHFYHGRTVSIRQKFPAKISNCSCTIRLLLSVSK